MRHRSIDGRPSAALLVVKWTVISQARQNEPVFDPIEHPLVSGETGDCTNCRRQKEEAIPQPPSSPRLPLGKRGGDSDSRQIVICETRMADVAGEQDFA